MPTVDVVDLTNEKVAELELADSVFGVAVNESLIHQAVTAHRAAGRAGAHKTKSRGEVSGSGKKPWRQKGTGRARVGSIRSTLWRGGSTTHGPRPRSYAQGLPRKMFRGALRSALTAQLNDGAVTVVQDFTLARPQDEDVRRRFGRAGRRPQGAGCRKRRQRESRAVEPEYPRRDSDRKPRSGPVLRARTRADTDLRGGRPEML